MGTHRLHDGNDTYEMIQDWLEASSLHRPDTSWRLTDAQGHVHQWHTNGKPADHYNVMRTYDTPTLIWVKDGEEWYEDDDEPHDVGHYECRECGERIKPRFTADITPQYIPGMRHYRINGERVSETEFQARVEEVKKRHASTH